jgi:hypothetical protein
MEDVLKLIKQYDGEIYNLCYKILKENKQHIEVFQYVCENLLAKPENPQIKIEEYFTKEELEEYESMYGDIVNGLIRSTIKRCDYGIIRPEDFYKNLWEGYAVNMLSLKELAFAFYYTIIDKKIPYIHIGKPLSMEQDKFKEVIKENRNHLKKIEYIFNSSYQQKTEIASLILQCIDNIDDYESKVVVLVKALDMNATKRNIGGSISLEGVIKEIERKIEELEQSED